MAIPGTIQFPALATTPSPPPTGSYLLYTENDNTLRMEDPLGNVYIFGNTTAITSLTGDVTATGPGSVVATVVAIQGSAVSNTAPTDAQFLVWNSGTSRYNPVSMSGDVSMSDTGVTTIASATVTGKLLTGLTTGTNTPIIATDSILTAFENLQAQVSAEFGDAITALTGDGTATGPGSVAFTLATVNSNVGSFGSSTSIPSFTVNAKGLITAASGNAVIAPAGTLTGTTLASNVVSSSLTSLGTITSGTWNGTTIAIANGGTGQTTANAAFAALSPMTTAGDIIYENATPAPARLPIGSTGNVLTVSGGLPVWAAPATSGTVTSVSVVSANGFAGTVATATTTPAITLSTTLNTPVLAGNGTALIAATTTGTGSTVVLNASPTLTGTITAAAATFSGTVTDQVMPILSASTAHTVLVAEGASAIVGVGPGTAGQVLQSGGASADPSFTSTLNSTVQGNITSLGTITTGVWNGTVTAGNSFLTSGTTYTTPAGITANTQFKFTLIGGGGAGGGSTASVGLPSYGGGGGGAGAVGILYLTGLTASTAYTIAIGSAGAGSSGAAGGNGGNTTLTVGATTYTAGGGFGGGVAVATSVVLGGVGGTTTNITLGIAGQYGGDFSFSTAAGDEARTTATGGSCMFGNGATGIACDQIAATAGRNAPTGYGGGGSGGTGGIPGSSNIAGGNGAQGAILVEWNN